ncbi:lipocalin family protein [Shewanella inventionis]|uniref:Outer membrane lipoprotein Blc n=1 Tax=Shewanella inventionis TaxID=1738770 RepID=A0ABQ1J3W4_9GAMM|nr:lipocalin family protein [Shewanella inventionis]MCL1157622.1 lipocalin family protein [Shewanella inventionis]UAL41527.1 lipocalin family protein [Shewanella inventionis]GGB59444.1 hypothetical protein GCM10011607_20150 [Shewanella inventionis]
MKTSLRHLITLPFLGICALGLSACTVIDEPVDVVKPFQLNQYLGTWYEVARLDHSFERGMTNVTAQYSIDGDKVVVINKGFKQDEQQWDSAEGKAYFIDGDDKGLLKVSFFGPFYGAYQIHDVVQNEQGLYTDSLVIGPNNKYAWILSRTPNINPTIKQRFIGKLNALSISEDQLIWVNQGDR